MEIIAKSSCQEMSCPTIYKDGEVDLIVQGYAEEMTTPSGEAAVRIPGALLLEAATAYSERLRQVE